MVTNEELRRIWKQEMIVCFKLLSERKLEETKSSVKKANFGPGILAEQAHAEVELVVVVLTPGLGSLSRK
jgi:hypothetical protein